MNSILADLVWFKWIPRLIYFQLKNIHRIVNSKPLLSLKLKRNSRIYLCVFGWIIFPFHLITVLPVGRFLSIQLWNFFKNLNGFWSLPFHLNNHVLWFHFFFPVVTFSRHLQWRLSGGRISFTGRNTALKMILLKRLFWMVTGIISE